MVCNSTLGTLSDEWFITFGLIMVIISVTGTFQNLLVSYKACSAGCLTKTYNVGQVLAIGNSAVNPLIYFLRSSKMRESAGKIIGEITKRCRFGASLDSHQMSQRSIETNVDADDYQFSHQSVEESNCDM